MDKRKERRGVEREVVESKRERASERRDRSVGGAASRISAVAVGEEAGREVAT